MPDLLFQPTPHTEAVDLIAGKSVVSREVFNGLLPELKARAFVVAGIEDANTVQQIRDLVAQLPAGANWADQKKHIAALASPFFVDPEADEETRAKQQNAAERKAELLLRTHGGQAYSSAAYQVQQRQKKVFPFLKYQSMGDGHVRESHAALDGIVLPQDHEFWREHYPPWQWGCRCLAIALSQDDYNDELKADAGQPEMERNILQGTRLRRLEEERKINHGPNADIDLRSDGEKGKENGYSWHPGDIKLTAKQLEGRYDPEVWSQFEHSARHHLVTPQLTVWQWMEGEVMSWPKDFPTVLTQTDGATLQSHPLYKAAKAGDAGAATALAGELISESTAKDLALQFPKATLIFVHAEEASGRNALPGAYAGVLEELSGLPADDTLVQVNRPQRTGATSGYRMATRAAFAGEVRAGRDYILVDDFITQGGTLADLRDYIAQRGGNVVAATTLASAPPAKGNDARQLAVLPENLVALEKKFGKVPLEKLLTDYAIHAGNPAALANSEATWLLRFPSAAHAAAAIDRDREQTLARRSGGPA